MAYPKLEFFRFSLKHKDEMPRTFREFMLETKKCKNTDTDDVIFSKLYNYFMANLVNGFAQNDRQKKCITIIKNPAGKTINKYWGMRPQPQNDKYIISGVVNGGAYGKERIITNLINKIESDNIRQTQPVLQYYYIFTYFPLDSSEGFFMIHTDSAQESISNFVRKYIAELFKQEDYLKPDMVIYAPKAIQDKFREDAHLTSLSFKTTMVGDRFEEDDPIKEELSEYDVSIVVKPKKGRSISMTFAERVRTHFVRKMFGTKEDPHTLDQFEDCRVGAKNDEMKSTKIFKWNTREAEFAPVVYLTDEMIRFNEDGTPDFTSLATFCDDLFQNIVLPELRIENNVERVD
ncbi:MAG: hypothetical protein U0K81_02295 [Paludibacteraceae bacterium]|nr:hypothetical protein [Paludibacteraceae bacterium]